MFFINMLHSSCV